MTSQCYLKAMKSLVKLLLNKRKSITKNKLKELRITTVLKLLCLKLVSLSIKVVNSILWRMTPFSLEHPQTMRGYRETIVFPVPISLRASKK